VSVVSMTNTRNVSGKHDVKTAALRKFSLRMNRTENREVLEIHARGSPVKWLTIFKPIHFMVAAGASRG